MVTTLVESGRGGGRPPGSILDVQAGMPDPGDSFMGRLFELKPPVPVVSSVPRAETARVDAHIEEVLGDLAIMAPSPPHSLN